MAAGDYTIADGTPICWAHADDYSDTNSGISQTTDHELDLTDLADNNARQSYKTDLGANRAPTYAVKVGIEFATDPDAGEPVYFYWSSSVSGTAGTGNDGNDVDGVDGAWQPGGDAEADRDEHAKHLTLIGVLPAAADDDPLVQYAMINTAFTPPTRHGSVIVYNKSGVALHSDATEMFVALIPHTHNVASS